MRAEPALAALALLSLTGCAGAATSGTASTENSTAAVNGPAKGAATPPPPALDGKDAAADLSDFTCTPDIGTQRWTASGTLTDGHDDAATYRVTVLVTDPSGRAGVARKMTTRVAAGGADEVTVRRVRGPDDGTCHVQVLRLP